MKKEDMFLVLGICLLVISFVAWGISYNRFISSNDKLTGFASQSGDINLTVESSASVNFTTDTINWGSGRVTEGQDNATLDTSAGADNVTNGNWTGNTDGFVIENIGNVNVSINISGATDADGLLGGTSPVYQFNYTMAKDNSCLNTSDWDVDFGSFTDVNSTPVKLCDVFDANDNQDTLRIDIKLVIPSDSNTGALGDILSVQIASV